MGIFPRTPASLAIRPQCRRMVDGDLPDILDIEHSTFDQPLNANGIIDLWAQKGTVAYVTEHRDLLAAYVIFTHYCDFIEIRRLAVDPIFRGMGNGCVLIERLQERVRSVPQMHCLVACVALRDLDTLEFFKRRGFRATCCIDSEGRDVICMEWLTN